jgi:hypothetical protein
MHNHTSGKVHQSSGAGPEFPMLWLVEHVHQYSEAVPGFPNINCHVPIGGASMLRGGTRVSPTEKCHALVGGACTSIIRGGARVCHALIGTSNFRGGAGFPNRKLPCSDWRSMYINLQRQGQGFPNIKLPRFDWRSMLHVLPTGGSTGNHYILEWYYRLGEVIKTPETELMSHEW